MNNMTHGIQAFIKKNSATILTWVGSIGVIATSVLAVKATPSAMALIDEKKAKKGSKLTVCEAIEIAGMTYVPSAITGMATIGCIFGANMLNKRQQASLLSAYVLLDNSYKTYKKKVEELYGGGSDREIRTQIAKDEYNKQNPKHIRLFYDEYSERYFECCTETLLQAEHCLMQAYENEGVIYLNDFYDRLGLDPLPHMNSIDWSSCEELQFEHTKVILDDNLECTIISLKI